MITNGEVRISKLIPDIGEEMLTVRKPGDYFGEMTLIDNFPHSTNAIANAPVALLAITKTDLDMGREPGYKLLWVFTKTLSKRRRETNEKMTSFLAKSGGF